ncbi:hypothetical protein D9613_011667 [Agrocybe pediades]|uniref:Uncharacterized protein n=1 Tax=Agrocybe pediades TaxID=84607 RepID=A0A8H4QVH2_9AGAR|nr:hypothetical protein D9613_011667 [Agrocybe pediades]
MVSTRTKKTLKPSYAERVLGAFSQIQREHRRHAVHLATIRAQVKKTAQERKDQLGPHWTQWVTKAINKLETDGILEPEKSTGNLTLTPIAKKAITHARRSLRLSGEELSKTEEDNLWKLVVTQGPKRLLTDEGTHSPKKRIRLSDVQPKRSKQQKQQPQLLRGISPLTDLDDDEEIEILRGELKTREREIADLRNELAGMKQQREQQLRQAENRTTTTIRNVPAGVARTQSGSFISHLSKQPTPAPSSPDRDADADAGADERLTDVDEMDLGQHNDDFIPQHDITQPEPEAIPLHPEIEQLRTQLKENTEELSIKNQSLLEKTKLLAEIQIRLDSLVNDRSTLQEENGRLSAELADTQKSWKQSQEATAKAIEELRGSESSVDKLRKEATVTTSRLSNLETANESLLRERDDLKDEIERAKGDYESALQELRKQIVQLELLEAEHKAEIQDTKTKLDEVSTEARTLQERNAQLDNSVTAYRKEVHEHTVSIANLGNVVEEKERRNKELAAELSAARESADTLIAQYEQAQATVTSLSESLTAVRATVVELEAQLKAATAQLEGQNDLAESLNLQLADKAGELTVVYGTLAESQRAISQLEERAASRDSVIQRLTEELATARGSGELAENALRDAEQRHAEERASLTCQIAGLNSSVTVANAEIESVNARLAEASQERDRLASALATETTEAEQLANSLETERQEKARLQDDLLKSKSMYEDLEEELLDFKAAKSADEKTITGLRKSFSNIRASQLKIFDELEGEITAAQASPVAKTRRSSRLRGPA